MKNKRFFTLLVSVALACSICLATSVGAEKKQDEKPTTTPATVPATAPAQKQVEPGFEKGAFDSLAVPIGRLLKLSWKGKTLQVDHENWTKDFEGKTKSEILKVLEAEAEKRYPGSGGWVKSMAERIFHATAPEQAFMRLQLTAGKFKRSRSGSTAGTRRSSFTTSKLKGKVEFSRLGSFRVVLEERESPERIIKFHDDGQGALMIGLSDKSGRLSLTLKQSRDGNVSVRHAAGDDVFAADAGSFTVFYAKHPRYVEDRLFPLLKHVGIGAPLTPYNAEVKKATLERLRSLSTPEKIAQGQRLIEQLNSNLYKKRQEASKALAADFDSYRFLIAQAIRKPSTPPETVSRLKMIVKARPKQKLVDEFVTVQGLTANVGYLVNLLGEVKPADRAIVAKALQRLTKQKFGPDPIAWKKWWSLKQTRESSGTGSK
ncbi:MAG: hypothetical protein KAV00_02725 [Phycisphaerae bacterium]|nr:hypothetical protein [Phycisphaerae bacterium]